MVLALLNGLTQVWCMRAPYRSCINAAPVRDVVKVSATVIARALGQSAHMSIENALCRHATSAKAVPQAADGYLLAAKRYCIVLVKETGAQSSPSGGTRHLRSTRLRPPAVSWLSRKLSGIVRRQLACCFVPLHILEWYSVISSLHVQCFT